MSWSTVLRKREGYRGAFEGFDPARVAEYGPTDIARLLDEPGIVRNRAKVASTIAGAQATLRSTTRVPGRRPPLVVRRRLDDG